MSTFTREEETNDAMDVDLDLEGQAGPSTGPGLLRFRRPSGTTSEHRMDGVVDEVERVDVGPSSVDRDSIVNGSDGAGQQPPSSELPFYPLRNRTGPPDLRHRLHSGQDLLDRLGLLSAFDELVRPFIRVPEGDKGKGKQVEIDGRIVELGLQIQEQEEPHEEHAKGWREFATAIPGRFSTKKDQYLTNLVSGEPRARTALKGLDRSTLTGFFLQEGQLDVETMNELGIGPESEKKKKHKDKKKAHAPSATASTPAINSAVAGPSGTTATTPASAAPGPSAAGPSNPKAPQRQAPNGVHQPKPQGPPQPQTPQLAGGQPAPAPRVPNGVAGPGVSQKSLKVRKERDEGAGSSTQDGLANGAQQPPRPHKKRKTDPAQSNGQPPRHPHPHKPPPHQPIQQATPTF